MDPPTAFHKTMEPSQEITQRLVEWNNGEPEALEKLLPMVEAELRRMRRENPDASQKI